MKPSDFNERNIKHRYAFSSKGKNTYSRVNLKKEKKLFWMKCEGLDGSQNSSRTFKVDILLAIQKA